jgi:hypothetical protein
MERTSYIFKTVIVRCMQVEPSILIRISGISGFSFIGYEHFRLRYKAFRILYHGGRTLDDSKWAHNSEVSSFLCRS